MKDYSTVGFISNYRGEYADEYRTHLEYVESGAWEKDYFAAWLEGCSDYPKLGEIMEFCEVINDALTEWIQGVETGEIDPEAEVKDED